MVYSLCIPSEEMNNSLLFELIDLNNKVQQIKSKREKFFEIREFVLMNSIVNKNNRDLSKKYSRFIYDISLYFDLHKLSRECLEYLKTNPYTSYDSILNFISKRENYLAKSKYMLIRTIKFLKNYKHEVFIRHGSEIFLKDQYSSNDKIFPLESASCWNDGVLYVNKNNRKKGEWSKKKRNSETNKIAFPIEVDMLPFCANLNTYLNRKWPSDPQFGYCSNHDGLFSWNKLKGFIPYKIFVEKGGSIINSKRRDHLYGTSEIAIESWLFVYQNLDKSQEKSKNWGWTQKKFNSTQFKHSIHLLLNQNVMVIPQDLLFELHKYF